MSIVNQILFKCEVLQYTGSNIVAMYSFCNEITSVYDGTGSVDYYLKDTLINTNDYVVKEWNDSLNIITSAEYSARFGTAGVTLNVGIVPFAPEPTMNGNMWVLENTTPAGTLTGLLGITLASPAYDYELQIKTSNGIKSTQLI